MSIQSNLENRAIVFLFFCLLITLSNTGCHQKTTQKQLKNPSSTRAKSNAFNPQKYVAPLRKPMKVKSSRLVGLTMEEVLKSLELAQLNAVPQKIDTYWFNGNVVARPKNKNFVLREMHLLTFERNLVVQHQITARPFPATLYRRPGL